MGGHTSRFPVLPGYFVSGSEPGASHADPVLETSRPGPTEGWRSSDSDGHCPSGSAAAVAGDLALLRRNCAFPVPDVLARGVLGRVATVHNHQGVTS